MLLNTPFLKDVPHPTAVWLLRHNTSLLSVCVFALFSLVSSLPLLSRLPPIQTFLKVLRTADLIYS